MKHSSLTREQFEKIYNDCCNVASEIFGEWISNGEFIEVPGATETEVGESIAKGVSDKMDSNDVERYLYVTSFNDVTLIKR